MRLFVTGGAGFIGSNFIRHVLATYPDYSVVNYDLLTYAGNPATVADLEGDSRYTFVPGDIADLARVSEAMWGCDGVVNFAAESHVDRSILDASAFVRTNIGGVQVLLDAAREASVGRFLHVSTDETYGSIEPGSFSEGDPLEPNSPYAASKAGADLLVRSYFVTHGMPVVVTRSSNNYGPWQFPEKVLPLFVTNLIDGEQVPLYGEGRNVRDWCFVEDNCRGIDTVLHHGREGEVYNIGAGNEITNLELTRRLLAIFGASEDMIRLVPDRPGHDLRYSINTDKVRKLGWEPQVSLDDGIQRAVEWYRSHESWWRPLKTKAAESALPSTLRGE